MARDLKQYDKEHMKIAMLKQEETFKQQVHELHRLYRVQKLLMTDMTNTSLNKHCALLNIETNHERFSPENETGSSKSCDSYSDQRKTPSVLEEIDLELTLAIGIAPKKRMKKEMPSSSDSRTSFSSSSTESGGPRSNGEECSLSQPSELASRILTPNIGQHLNQKGLKQPLWLHQCLNLA